MTTGQPCPWQYFQAALTQAPVPMDHLAYAFFMFLDGRQDEALEHVEAASAWAA